MARLRTAIAVVVVGLVLAACGYGVTGEATSDDITATLTGTADRTEPGSITFWFEYGTTTGYGAATLHDGATITGSIPVSAVVDGLSPQTTYHYRLCVRDFEDNQGVCGSDRTFTTGVARDHVRGVIEIAQLFQPPFHFGIQLNVSSDANGANAVGGVRGYNDDFTVLGTVTCLRIVGNRAAIGFLDADGAPWLTYIFDNGASGDSFDAFGVSTTLTNCPQPPPGPYRYVSNFGDIQFIDVS